MVVDAKRSAGHDMSYVVSVPGRPSYTHAGLSGYALFTNKDLDIDYIEVVKGHDTFQVSKRVSRFYYVVNGTGYFTIQGEKYEIRPGQLVCVPPKVEYSYSGAMSLLTVATPRWFQGNDITTRWNPDVVPEVGADVEWDRKWLTRLARRQLFGVSPVGAVLRMNRILWNTLPGALTACAALRSYASFLHRLARARSGGKRGDVLQTWFLRNRAALEAMRRIADRTDGGSILKVVVLGCQTGAELYSVAWWLRSSLPGLKVALRGVDATVWAIDSAKRAEYPAEGLELIGHGFCRMTEAEKDQVFDRSGDLMSVKSWLREGITWHVADVWDATLPGVLGTHDIVVVNHCLSGTDAGRSESALRNIARLVRPGGYMFVAGVDADVRTRVAKESGWIAVQDLLEDVYDGDPWSRSQWPFHYAGLEPMDKRRRDWQIRYAVIFQIPETTADAQGGETPGEYCRIQSRAASGSD